MRSLIAIVLPLLLLACGRTDGPPAHDKINSPGNEYARLFHIADSGQFRLLEIYSPWQGGEEIVYRYIISSEEPPPRYSDYEYVRLPVESAVCMSTTHVAMLSELGQSEKIVAVSGPAYVTDPVVRQRIDSGRVKDIGYDSNLNNELIVLLDPGIVFVYGIGPESAAYVARLRSGGIPVMFIGDYLETDPLAKAEWIKVFGILFDCSQLASEIFSEVSGRYEEIAKIIRDNNPEQPAVMLGLPYKDKWFVSPGNSYISKLISDAGGNYLWSEHISPESMPMSLETVYFRAMESDFWLNTGTADSKNDLLLVDKRFANLPPVQKGNIYNNTLRMNLTGGNDYWESGAVHPERLLEDIAKILHPDLFTDHELQYYRKLK